MRALSLLGLLIGLSALAGCATVTQSPGDVLSTYDRILAYELRQMADDTNFALLLDRPSRLTRWQMR